ncbi:hypothetical protein HHK36_003574 [Tetracentron sinense]|uniref:Uncharacterized protein n=1 Tax=Tetracentron sinense TaxID=13715 RepID=A0A834ZPA6_TETSI|nr:hypothetical protein HHK36_003574 [Tetracentron sinense]
MFTMDLQCKGINWVGNIYQKFEVMCMEVHDIIYQDTVEYVENQVQTVGASVKNFCSDVMQDILPPSSVDPMKGTAPCFSLEKNADVQTDKKSKVGIDEDPVKINIEHSPEESDVIASVENELGHVSSLSELCNVNHLLPPSSADPIKEAHSNLCLGHNDIFEMYRKANVEIKENPVKEKPPPSEMSEAIAPVDNYMSGASLFCGLLNGTHEKACDSPMKISPPTPVEVTDCDFPQRAGSYNNLVNITGDSADSSALPYSDLVVPVLSFDNKEVEMGLTPFNAVLSAESDDADISTTYETLSGSLIESSGIEHKQYVHSAQSEAFMPPPEIGRSDDSNAELSNGDNVTEPSMDAIEPFDKLKLEESCVMVDSNELCFVSSRVGKHRSYKKKIRDAFASKMRLAKKQEYEQLEIWARDINTVPNQQRVESLTPSTLTRDIDRKQILLHDFCESEWELL